MTSGRITWPRRAVAFLSLAAWLTAVWTGMGFLQSRGPWFFWTGVLFSFLGAGWLLLRFLHTFNSYGVEGGILRIRRLDRTREYPLADLDSFRENPSGGHLVLGFRGKKVKIPRRLTGFDALASALRGASGENLVPQDLYRIKSAKSPLLFYLVMEGLLAGFYGAVSTTASPGPGQIFLVSGVFLLGGFLLVRMLFFIPLEYLLDPEGIGVKFLFRRRYYASAAATRLVEDLYYADGAPFHLVKLVYSGRNLVLDEFNLQSSLVPLLPWIRENYGPAARSTF